jgi:hypothetical protein
MKTRKHFIGMVIAIIALAFTIIGCKHDEPPPPQPQPTLPNGVKIYKGEGVTDAQFATAVQNAIAGYNGVTDPAFIAELNRILTKVIIISHKNYTWDGHILGLKYNIEVSDFTNGFNLVGGGALPQVAW